MKNSKKQFIQNEELDEEAVRLDSQAEQEMKSIKIKHPDCIPVYFAKHKAAPNSLKQPKTPFMLFKGDLKIQQAMFRLYQQIETKGLYFFCLKITKDKAKYAKIQPGPTIKQTYDRYGRNQCLVLIYGNSEMGLEGLQKMQKCMLIALLIVGLIWVTLYSYQYFINSGSTKQLDQNNAGFGQEIN